MPISNKKKIEGKLIVVLPLAFMFKAKHMGISPSLVSCQTKSYACPKHSRPEEMSDAECECSEISEQKLWTMSETVQTEPGDTSTAVPQLLASKELQQYSEDATTFTLAEKLEPQPEDACKSSLTVKNLGPKLTVIDQKLEFGSEDTCSGPSKEYYLLGSGLIQDDNEPSTFTIDETSQPLSADAAKNSLTEDLKLPCQDASKSSQIGESPCPQQSMSGRTLEFSSDIVFCEPSLERTKDCCDSVKGELVEISMTLSSCTATGHLESPPVLLSKSSPSKYLGPASDNLVDIPAAEKLPPPHDEVDKHWNLEQSETLSKGAVSNSSWVGQRVKTAAKPSRKNYILRSLVGSGRVLRSRSQEKSKAPDLSAKLANISSKIEKTRKNKKKRQGKIIESDEYSRIRKRLRYLLTRMSYEQTLITAYCAEGWKGLRCVLSQIFDF